MSTIKLKKGSTPKRHERKTALKLPHKAVYHDAEFVCPRSEALRAMVHRLRGGEKKEESSSFFSSRGRAGVLERVKTPHVVSPLRTLSDPNFIYNFRIPFQYTVTSSGAGVYSGTLTADPSGSSEWSGLSGIFDQFWVRAIRWRFLPDNKYLTTAKASAPMVVASDFDSSAALTTYEGGMSHTQYSVFDVTDNHTHWFVRPTSRVGDPWIDVASPGSSLGGIKPYCSGLSNTTTYGLVFADYFIQFRTRQ